MPERDQAELAAWLLDLLPAPAHSDEGDAGLQEAVEVLMERLPASKVARLLSSWQIGRADYPKLREELFSGETVENLYEAASQPGHCSMVPLSDAYRLLPGRDA